MSPWCASRQTTGPGDPRRIQRALNTRDGQFPTGTEDDAMTKSKLVFDPFSEEHFNDPYDTYRRLRDEAPVYYSEQYDFYALSRHEDVAPAFKDFATYSSSRGVTLDEVQSGEHKSDQSMIWM